jgi:hypothetical protein
MTSFRDIYYTTAHCEIRAGKDAEAAGRTEDIIYYAQKACFFAISCWMEYHDIDNWEESFESYLKNASEYPSLPSDIRNSVKRLLEPYEYSKEKAHNIHPLDDAEKIIEYFLDKKNLYAKDE